MAKSQLSGSEPECPFASEDEEFLANIFNILMTVICGRSVVNLATVWLKGWNKLSNNVSYAQFSTLTDCHPSFSWVISLKIYQGTKPLMCLSKEVKETGSAQCSQREHDKG